MVERLYGFTIDASKILPYFQRRPSAKPVDGFKTFNEAEIEDVEPSDYGIDGNILIEKRYERVCHGPGDKGRRHNEYSTAVLFEDEGNFGALKLWGGIGKKPRYSNKWRAGGAGGYFGYSKGLAMNAFGNIESKIKDKSDGGCVYCEADEFKYGAERYGGIVSGIMGKLFWVGVGALGCWLFMRRRRP